uniref:Uncharacterized protein n=1 Tax=Tetranychus urticae TaxID=32264 RepID=T1K433_TETUR
MARLALDTCNGSCLTKTYNYQDLASVTFTAKQDDGINYFTIILTAYNIREGEYQKVAVAIDGNPGANVYSCERNSSGYIASYYARSFVQHTADNKYEHISVVIDGNPGINSYSCERNSSGATGSYYTNSFSQFSTGSSLYRDNTLYCFWTMSRTFSSWPKRSDGSPLDLEIDSDHEIRLYLADDDLRFLVAENTKDLPIYQLNFLKCCNTVYGNDKVQLFVRQSDNANEFTLQLVNISSFNPFVVGVFLTAPDTSELSSYWFVQNPVLSVDLKRKYVRLLPINSQLLYKYSWSSGVFTWAIPIVIKGFAEDYDTRNRIYDLKITIDGPSEYTKSGITLKSLGLTQIPSTFFVFSVFLFRQIIL